MFVTILFIFIFCFLCVMPVELSWRISYSGWTVLVPAATEGLDPGGRVGQNDL